jgi:hypothetical protein
MLACAIATPASPGGMADAVYGSDLDTRYDRLCQVQMQLPGVKCRHQVRERWECWHPDGVATRRGTPGHATPDVGGDRRLGREARRSAAVGRHAASAALDREGGRDLLEGPEQGELGNDG